MNTKSKHFLLALCALLPVAVILPYLLFVPEAQALKWAASTFYWPFWAFLVFSILTAQGCMLLVHRASQFAHKLYLFAVVIITLHVTYLAMSERRHLVLLLIFLDFAALIAAHEWMRYVLRLPYFHSRRKWWEAAPKALPGVRAAVTMDDGSKIPVTVSNLGETGCFIFFASPTKASKVKEIEIEFSKKDIFTSNVRVMMSTRDALGAGLFFMKEATKGDWWKDFQDYLNQLRRAGYEVG
jgi:hypothetical protein